MKLITAFGLAIFIVLAFSEAEAQTVNDFIPCADVEIPSGREFSIKNTYLGGNEYVRDRVIRRRLTFVEGDVFTLSSLKASARNLNRLKVFEPVSLKNF